MPAAHVMGWFNERATLPGWEWLRPEHILEESRMAFIGLRDVDIKERRMLRNSGVAVFTMHEVDRWGIAQVVDMALQRINPRHNRPIHLTFDIDGCDPSVAPGTGTCSRGGLSLREAHYICEKLSLSNSMTSMDVVEINPALDLPVPGQMHGDNQMISAETETVRLGIELIESALGRSIV